MDPVPLYRTAGNRFRFYTALFQVRFAASKEKPEQAMLPAGIKREALLLPAEDEL